METAALIATSMKHRQPGLDTVMLWNNLDSAQQGEGKDKVTLGAISGIF